MDTMESKLLVPLVKDYVDRRQRAYKKVMGGIPLERIGMLDGKDLTKGKSDDHGNENPDQIY